MCIIQPLKRRKPTISNNMNEPARLYAKWNKPDQERQILHGITDMWNLLKKKKKDRKKTKNELIETESRMVVATGRGGGNG